MSRLARLKHRAGRVELPKGAVALLCTTVLALPAGFAVAHVVKVDSQGRWIHHHTTDYTTCNQIDQSTALRDQFNVARNDWGWNNGNSLTGLVFNPEAECHSGNPVHIQVLDGYLGNTGWRSSAINDPNGQNLGYHVTHTHLQFNLSTNWTDYTNYDRRALACREIGQIIGVERVWSTQYSTHGTDCMAFGGNPSGQVSKDENGSNYTYSAGPWPDGTALVKGRYEGQKPAIELSGTLIPAIDSGVPLSEPVYTLTARATDGPLADAPLRSLRIHIDGHERKAGTTTCTTVRTCELLLDFSLIVADYSDGLHSLTVTATDALGLQRVVTRSLDIFPPPPFPPPDDTVTPVGLLGPDDEPLNCGSGIVRTTLPLPHPDTDVDGSHNPTPPPPGWSAESEDAAVPEVEAALVPVCRSDLSGEALARARSGPASPEVMWVPITEEDEQ